MADPKIYILKWGVRQCISPANARNELYAFVLEKNCEPVGAFAPPLLPLNPPLAFPGFQNGGMQAQQDRLSSTPLHYII